MARQSVRIRLQAAIVIMMFAVAVAGTLAGCAGGPSGTGAAAGWVYQPIGGGQPIVSASDTPPAGYEPVRGAVVKIAGYPELTMTTGADGAYLILNIPPGTQVLVVEAPKEPPLQFSIPIIAGRVTMGSGHEEGGGGIT